MTEFKTVKLSEPDAIEQIEELLRHGWKRSGGDFQESRFYRNANTNQQGKK